MIFENKISYHLFSGLKMSLDSYAFADKLVLAQAGTIIVGYSKIIKNEVLLDENRFIRIHSSLILNWTQMFYRLLDFNGEIGKDDKIDSQIMFDAFDLSKQYKCELNQTSKLLKIVKRFEGKETLTFTQREIIELLFMLSFFLIPSFGLPPTICVCFSHVINHFSNIENVVQMQENQPVDWKKTNNEILETTHGQLLDICTSIISYLNLETDSFSCFNSIVKFENLISPLVKMRLARKLYKC
jgi:hypothetical protein